MKTLEHKQYGNICYQSYYAPFSQSTQKYVHNTWNINNRKVIRVYELFANKHQVSGKDEWH